MDPSAFTPMRFAELPGWARADPAPALDAFRRSASALLAGGVRAGSLQIPPAALKPAAFAAATARPEDARAFFEHFFAPALIRPDPRTHGFVTGYYEPEVEASPIRTPRHRTPLRARPSDLVSLQAGEAEAAGLDPSFQFARRRPDGRLEEHPDRAAIARGALDGRGLEIAWIEDPADAFFIHIQGSARLRLTDGRSLRVGYAGKSGHPFTAIGRVLVQEGELPLEAADMAGIRRWLAAHSERRRALFDRNRSYIFFEASPIHDEATGPTGAAGVPLTALASLAVDGGLHTYGMPIFVDGPGLEVAGAPFRRLMVAQDTGSAILGSARGDIFVGSGPRAGAVAGAIRHPADLYALLPQGGVP